MKSNLHGTFGTNKVFEQEGVDFVVKGEEVIESTGEKLPEVSFRLRRFVSSNPRVKSAMAQYYKPFARQIDMGTLPAEKGDELAIRLFIDVCLVSWAGVLDEKNQPIECTKENAYKLFKELPDLFGTLQKYANDFESYKDDVGNS